MAMVERSLAGPGWPDTALKVLVDAEWDVSRMESGNVFATPPGRHLVVAFLPEENTFAPRDHLWVVRAYDHLHRSLWEAAFTADTPSESIAAFLRDLVSEEKLDPERDADI